MSELDTLIKSLDSNEQLHVKAVWKHAMQLLNNSPRFLYYTLHGSEHHESLLRLLSILIKGGLTLSQKEAYLLLLAIAVHDIGMVLPMKDYTLQRVSEGRPGILDQTHYHPIGRRDIG